MFSSSAEILLQTVSVYRLSQKFRAILKYDYETSRRYKWNNFTKNTQNVIEMKFSREIRIATTLALFKKYAFFIFG